MFTTKLQKPQDHDIKPRRLRVWLISLALFSLPIAALAAPSTASAAPRLEVRVIEAKSQGEARIDPALKKIGAKLKRSFKGFKSFKLIKLKEYQATKSDYTLSISPSLNAKLKLTTKGKGVKLTTKVKRKKGVTHAEYGELFFQAFRWKGKALILAVVVRNK